MKWFYEKKICSTSIKYCVHNLIQITIYNYILLYKLVHLLLNITVQFTYTALQLGGSAQSMASKMFKSWRYF